MKRLKKKHIVSAFLLALAVAVAPIGTVFSNVATASSGNAMAAYDNANMQLYNAASGSITPKEALQAIYAGNEKYNPEELPELMEAEPRIKAIITQLKMMAGIIGEDGVEPSVVEVSPEAKQKVPSVSVWGTELIAAAGTDPVTVHVALPEKEADIAWDNVQLDISLTGAVDNHNPGSPVIISISSPSGFTANVGTTQVWHYVNGVENNPVPVACNVSSNGSISFSTNSFSVFALVNVIEDEDDEDDDDDDDDSTEEQSADQPVKDSVPKTDDSTVPVLPFAAAGAVCAAAAYGLKKRQS